MASRERYRTPPDAPGFPGHRVSTELDALRRRVAELEANPGAATFLDLTDTPAAYTGQGGKAVAVKGDESGLEFVSPAGGGGGPESMTDAAMMALSSPTEGTIVYNTTAHAPYFFNGLFWEPFGSTPEGVHSHFNDFVGMWNTAAVGQAQGWFFQNLPSTTAITAPAGRVGLMRLSRSSTTPATGAYSPGGPSSGGESFVMSDFYYTRLDVLIDSDLSSRDFQFGIGTLGGIQSNPISVDDGAYFEFVSGDSAEWQTVVRSGSSGSNEDSGITVVADTWYRLEILYTGSVLRMYINGTLVKTETTDLPSSSAAVAPFFRMRCHSATARAVIFDCFKILSRPLSR